MLSSLFYFNFFFALNFVQVFESNKTTRHTAKRGMPQAVYFWKQGCACLPPPPPTPLCLFVLRLLCLFHAVSKQLSSSCRAHTNISLHFNTLLLPRPRTHSPLNSKKQQPSGRWKFFFPFPSTLLGKETEKKEKLFLHNEFLRIFHLYEPVQPLPPLSPLSPAGNRFVVLVACLTVKNFHFPFYFFSLCCSCSKSHRARLTMQIAGKYLGLWLGKLQGGEGEG